MVIGCLLQTALVTAAASCCHRFPRDSRFSHSTVTRRSRSSPPRSSLRWPRALRPMVSLSNGSAHAAAPTLPLHGRAFTGWAWPTLWASPDDAGALRYLCIPKAGSTSMRAVLDGGGTAALRRRMRHAAMPYVPELLTFVDDRAKDTGRGVAIERQRRDHQCS